jgi:hypothetical protein
VAASTGFGKPKQTKTSKSAEKRAQASEQYDKMKAKGLPEFTIFIRIYGKNNWFPVGSLAVSRTSKINQAIFDQEAELLQGALRLFPVLKKHQGQLEYGYRLKEFADEPIQVATRPHPATEGMLQGLKTRVAGLLKR